MNWRAFLKTVLHVGWIWIGFTVLFSYGIGTGNHALVFAAMAGGAVIVPFTIGYYFILKIEISANKTFDVIKQVMAKAKPDSHPRHMVEKDKK